MHQILSGTPRVHGVRARYPVAVVGLHRKERVVFRKIRSPVLQFKHAVSLIPYTGSPLCMDPVISQIRQELKSHADPEIRNTSRRFFKEEITCYGMKTATVTAIAKKYWNEVKGRPKAEIFALCEELYRSGYMEESFIVSNWVHALSGRYEREDLSVFRHWIG
ncbi:MAG TPA: DNA alkylation repair protein, partial [Methanoregula sp.]|nr:DNA alkylation repair protein [Methanoregula sp.]